MRATTTGGTGSGTSAAAHPPRLPTGQAVAVLIARAGEPPPGGEETVTEAGGHAVLLGDGARDAAGALRSARRIWWRDTGAGLQPGRLSARLAPLLADVPLVLLPASPDGRDLAPRLAAELDRPLLTHAVRADHDTWRGVVWAELSRMTDRLVIPVEVDGPAVVTMALGGGVVRDQAEPAELVPLPPETGATGEATETGETARLDADIVEILESDPATMDLAEAELVFGGGAGLAAGADDATARKLFDLLVEVAAALGASAGATRVATDAGWIGYDRQIGTTGVSVRPRLYVAVGVSGAAQHIGGLGTPRHVVSVNLDPSCPMTTMANLGLVADARGLLVELARRLDLDIPEELR